MTADIKWLAQLGAIEIREDTIESEGASYPYAQWVNGDQALRKLGLDDVTYTGGWFIPADRMPLDSLPGWTHGALAHRDGNETEGWFAKQLSIAVIHIRRCWQVYMGDHGVNYAWRSYDEAKAAGAPFGNTPRGRLQVLGIIRDLEAAGPIMLTLKGTTGMAFTANDGIFALHRQHVLVAAANYASKASKRRIGQYPRFYFWLTVGPEADAKGQPVFTKAGSGEQSRLVTRPVLMGVAKGMTAQQLGELYVGPELIATIEGSRDPVTGQWSEDGLFDETRPWAEAWDQLGQPNPNAAANLAALDAAADNNVLIDEELPF